jgi:hypothetical protein
LVVAEWTDGYKQHPHARKKGIALATAAFTYSPHNHEIYNQQIHTSPPTIHPWPLVLRKRK